MWVFITSGRGPGECQIAVQRLLPILIKEAKDAGVGIEVLDAEEGKYGLLSVLLVLHGEAAEAMAASWDGTIQWTCPSPIRSHRGRKNWYVAISVIRSPTAAAHMRESDLRFEAYRASGPGGQHVNKTSSAIRVTHLPTGAVAQAQEERSQHRNKALAVARLATILAKRQAAIEQAVEQEKWSKHDGLERGNPVRVYWGLEFTRR
jgi:peptide chain release factor